MFNTIKKKWSLAFILTLVMILVLVPSVFATEPVSTLAELQAAIAGEDDEIIIENAITLLDGTVLDGNGKTVRVEKPYVKEDGTLEQSPSSSNVFEIESSSHVTIKNMTIMGGAKSSSGAVSSNGYLTMENVNIVRSRRGLDAYGGVNILKNCNLSLNVCESAGAIWCGNGTKLVLDGCSLTQNRSNGGSGMGGGAIGVSGTGSSLFANNTIFAENATEENGGAINIYNGRAYLMNCTVAGNVTSSSSANAGGGIGKNEGMFHAINSIFVDNYANITSTKARSDIGIYSGNNGTLHNCVYGSLNGSITTLSNCKIDESNNTASEYTDAGIILSTGDTSTSFTHPALSSDTNEYAKYILLNVNGEAASGGIETYFDYSDVTDVRMGFGEDGSMAVGNLYVPESSEKVTTYFEGGTRVDGVIGASGTSGEAVESSTITGSSVQRTSATSATVKFYSDKAGTYYYYVSNSSTVPSADEIKEADSGVYGNDDTIVGTNTINLTGLSSGEQYVYVLVDNGSDSNILTIEIPYNIYYFENFESYPLDEYISSGALSPISQIHDGNGAGNQKVVTSITEGKMLSLTSSGSWASNQIIRWNGMVPTTGVYVFEGDISTTYSSTETDSWLARFTMTNGNYGKPNKEMGVQFEYTDIREATGEEIALKDSFTKNTWYHIKIEAFPENNMVFVYIDGEKFGPFEIPSGIDRMAITAGHGYTAYYDNLVYYADPSLEVPIMRKLVVNNGTSDADTVVEEDTTVTITADEPPAGLVFYRWNVISGGIELEDANSATTTFTMGTENVEVTAHYKTVIDTISITGVNLPVSGETASTSATISTEGLTTTLAQWETLESAVVTGDPFVEGTSYNLVIGYSIEDGYEVSDLATIEANEDPENTFLSTEGRWLSLTYTVPSASIKTQLTKPTLETDEFVYDGSEISVSIVDLDEDNCAVTGTTEATGVGEYTITISINDKENYEWSDGTNDDIELTWSIVLPDFEGSITVPTFDNVEVGYSSIAKKPVRITIGNEYYIDPARLSYEITGTNTDAFSISLNNSAGIMYGDGSWDNIFSAGPVDGLTAGTYTATLTLKYDEDGDDVYEITVGSGTLTFVVSEATPATYTVTLNPNGGSVTPTSIEATKGSAYGELPTPTNTSDVTFNGWYNQYMTANLIDVYNPDTYDNYVLRIAPGSTHNSGLLSAGDTLVFDVTFDDNTPLNVDINDTSVSSSLYTIEGNRIYGTITLTSSNIRTDYYSNYAFFDINCENEVNGYTINDYKVFKNSVSASPITSTTIFDVDNNVTLYAGWSPVKIETAITTQTYEVTFDANGGNGEMDEELVNANSQYTLPACGFTAPEGKVFDKWNLGKKGAKITVTEDVTLVAQWKDKPVSTGGGGGSSTTTYKITTKAENGTITPNSPEVEKGKDQKFKFKANDGYEIEDVLVDGESVGKVTSYTLEDVKAKHTIEVKFAKVEEGQNGSGESNGTSENPFEDVKETDWFYDSVMNVVKAGLFNGLSSTRFAPNMNLTRGMLVTVLYRYAGAEETEKSTFDDVAQNAYYSEAVAWAAKNEIVYGVGNNKFNPDANITRQDLSSIIYRYMKMQGKGFNGMWAFLLEYVDREDISDYAYEPVCYLTMNEIVTGKNENRFDPKGLATRAEAATIMERLSIFMGEN